MTPETPWYGKYGEVPSNLEYPDMTMYECLMRSASDGPETVACEFMGRKMRYSDLIVEVDAMAAALHGLGIRKGDKVLVCLPNSPQALISIYGINRLGAVATMIHPLSAREEIKFYIENSGSKAAIVLDLFYPNFPAVDGSGTLKNIIVTSIKDGLGAGKALLYQIVQGRKDPKPKFDGKVIRWNDVIGIGRRSEPPPIFSAKEDLACILYSGGTTGRSKGVLLSNMNINAAAVQTMTMSESGEVGDTMLAIMPVFHGFGLCICVHMVLYMGRTCILIPKFEPRSYANIVVKNKPNFIVGVPSLFELMLRNKRIGDADLSHLKGVFCGGDTLTADLKKRVDAFLREHRCRTTVREGYGATECVAASCLAPKSEEKQREGSIGIPFPDTLYKIVRVGTIEAADYGEDGEICISGPSVMMGYVNEPEETAEALKVHGDGIRWLHTGDIGCMDRDGYVYFKHRIKRMIISSGYNIYPNQIENVINSVPFVRSCYAIGIPHPIYSQVVKVFVVLEDGTSPTSETKERIMEVCRDKVFRYALPRQIEFLNELPITKLGKIYHAELEKLCPEIGELHDPFSPRPAQNM